MRVADAVVERLLEAIEQRELASLRWGYVDGSLSEAEVDALAHEAIAACGAAVDAEDLVEALHEAKLLFESQQADGSYRWRSRFAESVRLLARLKQLFPDRPWLAAPNLVSDYRVDARPRLVPRRELPPAAVLAQLELPVGELAQAVAAALLQRDGAPLKLSRFQLAATRRILQDDGRDRGTVVSAGTGSGKTLAFYLPALIALAPWIEKGSYWTKALAIYPRRELLKDQFAEAFELARRVDRVLQARGRRPLTIGTNFGLTPRTNSVKDLTDAKWPRLDDGYSCPFLPCPRCGGPMLWRERDLQRGLEQLSCRVLSCGGRATADQVVLTRQRARREPPDITFTTVESLHQRLSDTYNRVAFGVRPERDKRVRLVLLDEVHTYTGTSGAQNALALWRWRQAVGQPLRWVGLSATLRDAAPFFATLVGLREERVAEVAPRAEELEPLGMAYQLVLRGDPVSQTNLLSTSIQATFLLARLLEAPAATKSGGRFGRRVFVFTDDLDVTNRLFDNLRDAEAYNIFGRPDPKRTPLASLRAGNLPLQRQRDTHGQNWQVCEAIGWKLGERLRITRTSSQDAGVDLTSNVVVATSTLEVGFDDPTVGAVLQHKSPHQLASFVQRRGRAGRPVEMRPWMVTVLSDYGRDRLTYQTYEQLFDPTLPAQSLPVRNRYVLRMQAVFAFLDWLAEVGLSRGRRNWWRYTLKGPATDEGQKADQAWVGDILKQLLRGEGGWEARLSAHLQHALHLTADEVGRLLWEPPRALLLEVVPTLARRLATNWESIPTSPPGPATDRFVAPPAVHPLPDFVPGSLFGPLDLPEVTLYLPPATRTSAPTCETVTALQALQQLAPGRVTRRFAHARGGLHHWVPVSTTAPVYDLPVERYANASDYLGEVTVNLDDGPQQVPCYRPTQIRLENVSERQVRPTSNASMCWSSELCPVGEPLRFPVPQNRGWGEVVRALEFYLHGFRAAVSVRRVAAEAVATLRLPRSDDAMVVRTRFRGSDGTPAAVGFAQEVDAVRVELALPSADVLAARARESESLPAWRAAYFRDRAQADPLLRAESDFFQRDWLHQIYLSALTAEACVAEVPLQVARDQLRARGEHAFDAVMETLFRIQEPVADLDEDGGIEEVEPGRLEQRLRDLLARPAVREALHDRASELWAPDEAAWQAWLRQRTHETLGEALLLACQSIAPRHAMVETLLLDLDAGETAAPGEEQKEIWLTESSPGGTGVIEAIAEAFAADQRALFTALEAALTPSDLELTSNNLDAFVRLVNTDGDVAAQVGRVREARGHDQRQTERAQLYRLLSRRSLSVHHALSVALEHRLLRERMDPAGDALLGELLEYWRTLEQRLGIALDLRVFCYLAVGGETGGERVRRWLARQSGGELGTAEMVGVLAGVLWPRPAELRGRGLESYSPFRERSRTDGALVRELLLADSVEEILVGSTEWPQQVVAALARAGRTRIVAPAHDEDALQRGLLELLATPVDVEYLQFYAVIEQATRDTERVSVTLILREIAAA